MNDESLSKKRHRNAYEDSEDLDWIYDEKDLKDSVKKLKMKFPLEWKTIKDIFGEELTK